MNAFEYPFKIGHQGKAEGISENKNTFIHERLKMLISPGENEVVSFFNLEIAVSAYIYEIPIKLSRLSKRALGQPRVEHGFKKSVEGHIGTKCVPVCICFIIENSSIFIIAYTVYCMKDIYVMLLQIAYKILRHLVC